MREAVFEEPFEARFDWYSCTIDEDAFVVLSTVAADYPLSEIRPVRAMNGYSEAYGLFESSASQKPFVRVMYGGDSVGRRTFVSVSGYRSHGVASVVRKHFPGHYVTRMDSAVDFDGVGTWESLYSLALEVADQYGISVQHYGDFHRGEGGRTLYVGSRSSVVRLCIYEKGIERNLAENTSRHSRDWVRAELRVNPKNDLAKLAHANTEAMDAWGCSKFSASFARRSLEIDLDVITGNGTLRKVSDHDRALAYMFAQYAKALLCKRSEYANVEDFNAYMHAQIDHACKPTGEPQPDVRSDCGSSVA